MKTITTLALALLASVLPAQAQQPGLQALQAWADSGHAPRWAQVYRAFPSGQMPGLAVITFPGHIFWSASNAYECWITDDQNNAITGEAPVSGFIAAPPGTYIVHARGERGFTVSLYVQVP